MQVYCMTYSNYAMSKENFLDLKFNKSIKSELDVPPTRSNNKVPLCLL